jgi:hypothetical protein
MKMKWEEGNWKDRGKSVKKGRGGEGMVREDKELKFVTKPSSLLLIKNILAVHLEIRGNRQAPSPSFFSSSVGSGVSAFWRYPGECVGGCEVDILSAVTR